MNKVRPIIDHSKTKCPFIKTDTEINKLRDYKYKYFVNLIKKKQLHFLKIILNLKITVNRF